MIALAAACPGCVRTTMERSTAEIHRSGRSHEGARDHRDGDEPAPDEAVDEPETAPEEAASREPSEVTSGDERPALEVLTGRASYYADRFEGRSTASGEPYRAAELTAASRDLPFGTVLRVIRVDTGASVVVRVNDRGPFRDHSRILDLSRAAAEALDMISAGVIEVRAEVLERGEGLRHP